MVEEKKIISKGKILLLASILLIVSVSSVFIYLFNKKIGELETRLENIEEAVRQSPPVIIGGGLPGEGIEVPLP